MKKIFIFLFSTLFLSTSYGANFYLSPNFTLYNVSSQSGNFRGLEPRLNAGYGQMVATDTYLAAEIFATIFTITLTNNKPEDISLKTTRSFGISLLPGYLLNPNTMGYLRLGMISSKFTGPNTTRNGGQMGLGLQTALDRSLSLRFEYTYSMYSSVSGLGAPKADEFVLGLVYYFN